jgi:hypothetical protein
MRDADLNFEDIKRFKYSARDPHEMLGALGSKSIPSTHQLHAR